MWLDHASNPITNTHFKYAADHKLTKNVIREQHTQMHSLLPHSSWEVFWEKCKMFVATAGGTGNHVGSQVHAFSSMRRFTNAAPNSNCQKENDNLHRIFTQG